VPHLLLGLTSLSALGYTAKKVTERGEPKLTSLVPQRAPAGTSVELWGQNIVLRAKGEPILPSVTFDGISAVVTPSKVSRNEKDCVLVEVPSLASGEGKKVTAVVQGTQTNDFAVEGVSVRRVVPSAVPAAGLPTLRVFGNGLGPGVEATLAGKPLAPVEPGTWTAKR
jgi:hypothetical protein